MRQASVRPTSQDDRRSALSQAGAKCFGTPLPTCAVRRIEAEVRPSGANDQVGNTPKKKSGRALVSTRPDGDFKTGFGPGGGLTSADAAPADPRLRHRAAPGRSAR